MGFLEKKYLIMKAQNISVKNSEIAKISIIYASLLRKNEYSSKGL